MTRQAFTFASRAGLRPVGAVVLLALLLVAVGVRVVHLAAAEPSPARVLRASEPRPKSLPRYTLTDRHGAPLALSHGVFALEASPFNLWLAHTPEQLRERFEAALDLEPRDFESFWRRMMGVGQDGVLRAERWPLTASEALLVSDWLSAGGPAASRRTEEERAHLGPLRGMWLEVHRPDERTAPLLEGESGPFFVLHWRPEVLLSRGEREACLPQLVTRRTAAATWVRTLGSDLHRLLSGPMAREARLRGAAGGEGCLALIGDPRRLHRNHECVFLGLQPKRFAPLLDPVPSQALPALRGIFESERIGPNALWLRPSSTRTYPAGDLGAVGRWGWSGAENESEPVPLPGLERLADRLLAELEAESGVRLREGSAADLERRVLLARRPGLQRGYYLQHLDAEAPAAVESTLDLDLSRFVGLRLERALRESEAASAMAVVLDLETREVLALEWRDAYRSTLWSPLQRLYTPGSTWKVVTMALALDEGLVHPDEVLDVGQGEYLLRNDEGRVVRRIGEAEGFRRGRITAAECVAHSSNAGMVQIGVRIPPAVWKQRTRALGYGTPAAPELAGDFYNPPGRVGESESRGGRAWALGRSLASVSFGDSISLNLLQHAAGLAAILGGGEWQPLVFARAVHAEGQRFVLPTPERQRVIRPRTSELLVDMCRLGAEMGTGKGLLRPETFRLGTKTGTTEKLPNDVCSHVWGSAYERALEAGTAWDDAAEYGRYRGRWGNGRRSCYVSSIAAFADSADGTRRYLTLVVIDDPHAPGRPFGSRHAGPVAVDVLQEALGYTVGGAAPILRLADGLWPMDLAQINPAVLPWLEPLDAGYVRFGPLEGFRGSAPEAAPTASPPAGSAGR